MAGETRAAMVRAMPPRRPGHRIGLWIAFCLALLALNLVLSVRATEPAARVRVPYSPFFVQQVRDGHVASITSTGASIQGTFTRVERYGGSSLTTLFSTEVPAF